MVKLKGVGVKSWVRVDLKACSVVVSLVNCDLVNKRWQLLLLIYWQMCSSN